MTERKARVPNPAVGANPADIEPEVAYRVAKLTEGQLDCLRLVAQPAAGIQPEALFARGYNPRRRRPLARRLAITLRPPGVRLRTRNPCVRARRVLEGW